MTKKMHLALFQFQFQKHFFERAYVFKIEGCCRNYLFLNKFRHKYSEALMFVKNNYKMQYASHKRI